MRYFKSIPGGDVYTIKEDKHLTYFLSRPEQFTEVILTDKPKPMERVVYINMYRDDRPTVTYSTREKADANAYSPDRIGCKRVVFTEGEYDE